MIGGEDIVEMPAQQDHSLLIRGVHSQDLCREKGQNGAVDFFQHALWESQKKFSKPVPGPVFKYKNHAKTTILASSLPLTRG